MPRDINGVYTLPAGNPVVPGTVISTTWANATLNDIAAALTASITQTAADARYANLTGDTFTGGVTVPSLNGGQLAGMRNKIINGDMWTDQRNSGAAVVDSAGASSFVVDRWRVITRTGATITAQRYASGGGQSRTHLAVIITSAKTPASTDQFRITQSIEGLSVADLWLGTLSAKTVTLSFETCHSVTGTFSGALFNSDFSRSFVFTYTQNAANTWEQKSVTVPLDTAGTWLTDTSAGLIVSFDYGSGSSLQTATLNTWQAGGFLRSASSNTLVSTAGAIFRLQAVQLEVGSVATPFEHRPCGTELSLCQRYYQSYSGSLTLSSNGPSANINSKILQVQMRTTPTIVQSSSGTGASWIANDRALLQSGEHSVDALTATLQLSAEL